MSTSEFLLLIFLNAALVSTSVISPQAAASMTSSPPEENMTSPPEENMTSAPAARVTSSQHVSGSVFLPWTKWSSCSSTCGRGIRHRERKCVTAGKTCSETQYQRIRCFSPSCWSDWVETRPCSRTCGARHEVRLRYRVCVSAFSMINPIQECSGKSYDQQPCNSEPCPSWSPWSKFSYCSRTCGQGSKYRTRRCLERRCMGRTFEVLPCNTQSCSSYHWSSWSKFGCCSVSCGSGFMARSRKCKTEGEEWIHASETKQSFCEGAGVEEKICEAPTCNSTTSSNFLNLNNCGVKNESVKKIFGGNQVAGKWPWQASWQQRHCSGCWWRHFCGATLISDKWVLTAGHCIHLIDVDLDMDSPSSLHLSVLVGTNDLYTGGERKEIERVFIHPSYVYKYVTFADVALIKLKDPIEITEMATPVCLPFGQNIDLTETCYVTGWGYTGPLNDPRTRELPSLREAILPLVDFDQCQRLGENYKERLKRESHLCAGDPITASQDACRGDSGGPLSCYSNEHARWYINGVTSFSFKHCGTPGHVGVYARVTSYTEWIRLVVVNDERQLC